MPILDKAPGLLEALRGEMTPKFLASRSVTGVPNVVPVVSTLPADDQPDTLFFGNFLLRKTIRNLGQDRRVAVLVVTPKMQGWILRGDFIEFQRTGPYVERQMSSSLLRYNAYTGIRNAGIVHVSAVEEAFALSKGRVALEYLLAWVAKQGRSHLAGGVVVPRPVRQEFARMVAVKVLAWIGQDGYPTVLPALSLQPAGERAMVYWRGPQAGPPLGAPVAANVLTFAAVSYQAKGRCTETGRACSFQVEEVYAGGPPIPGGRVA